MLIKPIRTIDVTTDPGLPGGIVKKRKEIIPTITLPKYHWMKDKLDTRDYAYTVSNITHPNSIDLRAHCSAIDDQGQIGSCTGHGIAAAIEYLNIKAGKPLEISRLFVYYYERLIEGTINSDSGAQIRDGIKATYTYGAPNEALWPYNVAKFKTKPTLSAINDAAKRKVTLYERAADFNACIDALANGFPVVIGFSVYSSFESDAVAKTGVMPYPNIKTEQALGGHCVLIVGYDNTSQRFIVRNSWGSGWGDKGYFTMPYQVIQNTQMSSDFWVIKAVNSV